MVFYLTYSKSSNMGFKLLILAHKKPVYLRQEYHMYAYSDQLPELHSFNFIWFTTIGEQLKTTVSFVS